MPSVNNPAKCKEYCPTCGLHSSSPCFLHVHTVWDNVWSCGSISNVGLQPFVYSGDVHLWNFVRRMRLEEEELHPRQGENDVFCEIGDSR